LLEEIGVWCIAYGDDAAQIETQPVGFLAN
jgi:hypothetical protein